MDHERDKRDPEKRARDEDNARRRAVGPLAVGGLIASLTQPLMRGKAAAVARLALDWPSVVGPALGAVTAPERLSGGAEGATLVIRASGPVALELTHLAPQLLERINAHLGRSSVVRLRFTQGRRRSSGIGPAEERPRPPAPPTRQAKDTAQAAVSDLPEGPLRDALARLGAAVLSR